MYKIIVNIFQMTPSNFILNIHNTMYEIDIDIFGLKIVHL